ncbi:MAG: hypothetical protein AB8E15_06370 [Bdellovibrionales bacterium]
MIRSLIVVSLILPILVEGKTSKNNNPSFVKKNKNFSEKVDSFVTGLDLFLTGRTEHSLESSRENRTTLILGNQFFNREGGETDYVPKFSAELDFPNLQESLKLSFSSFDEDQAGANIDANRVSSDNTEESFGTSVEYNKKLGKLKFIFRPRLEISPILGLSHLIRLENDIQVGSWVFKPRVSFYAKPDTGTGQYTQLNFEKKISALKLLSIINEWEYSNFDNSFTVNNGIIFNHIYNSQVNTMTSLVLESNQRPNYHLEKMTLAYGAFHKIFNRVFHYGATPFWEFSKERRFKGTAGIRIDAVFIF